MGIDSVGKHIAAFRKDRGATQEELAKFTGVTAQAVSKWENGGVPDTELLPKIADYFGVSIDKLFGRNISDYSDLETAMAKRLIESNSKEQYNTAFELCWAMERAICGSYPDRAGLDEVRFDLGKNGQIYSTTQKDEGYTLMGLGERLPYFLLVPEAQDKNAALLKGIDYVTLFRDLADPVVFNTLVMLNKREQDKAFTPNLLIKRLGIDFDKAAEVIRTLAKYGMIQSTTIEMDDTKQEVYSFQPSPAFPAMLIFARELIEKPNSHCFYYGGRVKPYLL